MVPPPPSRALALGDEHCALRGPRQGLLPEDVVGGRDLLPDLQVEVREGDVAGNPLGGEHVAVRRQAVAPVGGGVNGDAPLPKLRNGLPYGSPGDGELLRQGLPGEILPPVGL